MFERSTAFGHLPTPIYIASDQPEYAGNPCVEALPPFRLVRELKAEFGVFPAFSKTERDLPDGLRYLKISRLRSWLQPLTHHEKVINHLGSMVRDGYVGRDPTDPDGHKSRVEVYRRLMADGYVLPTAGVTPSTAASLALFGTSGVGKTTLIEFALRALLPQVIYHPNGGFAQIVWLKLDCPPDGSVKQLLLAIIAKIDALLLTNYRHQMKGAVVDHLILFVAKLFVMHNVGLLVIDEIQNLVTKKNHDHRVMLNFFVSISNEARVPILTMGTPLAERLLSGTLRQARRTGDMGTILWDRMKAGTNWDLFMGSMQKYQWVKNAAKLDQASRDALYRETMGIPALTVRLFQLVQMEAIADGSEAVTVRNIGNVASERFVLLRPMLDALRAGKNVDRFEDLFRVALDKVDDDVDKVADVLVRNRREATPRERAIATLMTSYGRQETVRVVDDALSTEPSLDEDGIVERVTRALEGDPAMDDLPPSFDDDLASIHPQGPDLQEAIFKAKAQRSGKGTAAHPRNKGKRDAAGAVQAG